MSKRKAIGDTQEEEKQRLRQIARTSDRADVAPLPKFYCIDPTRSFCVEGKKLDAKYIDLKAMESYPTQKTCQENCSTGLIPQLSNLIGEYLEPEENTKLMVQEQENIRVGVGQQASELAVSLRAYRAAQDFVDIATKGTESKLTDRINEEIRIPWISRHGLVYLFQTLVLLVQAFVIMEEKSFSGIPIPSHPQTITQIKMRKVHDIVEFGLNHAMTLYGAKRTISEIVFSHMNNESGRMLLVKMRRLVYQDNDIVAQGFLFQGIVLTLKELKALTFRGPAPTDMPSHPAWRNYAEEVFRIDSNRFWQYVVYDHLPGEPYLQTAVEVFYEEFDDKSDSRYRFMFQMLPIVLGMYVMQEFSRQTQSYRSIQYIPFCFSIALQNLLARADVLGQRDVLLPFVKWLRKMAQTEIEYYLQKEAVLAARYPERKVSDIHPHDEVIEYFRRDALQRLVVFIGEQFPALAHFATTPPNAAVLPKFEPFFDANMIEALKIVEATRYKEPGQVIENVPVARQPIGLNPANLVLQTNARSGGKQPKVMNRLF
jgi:hypothetical protein